MKDKRPIGKIEKLGLVCPSCACTHFEVVYTRRMSNGKIMRRRECRNCGRKVVTYEIVVG